MPKLKRNPCKRRTWHDVPDEILLSRNINGSVFDHLPRKPRRCSGQGSSSTGQSEWLPVFIDMPQMQTHSLQAMFTENVRRAYPSQSQ
jgi:hypothetical protein